MDPVEGLLDEEFFLRASPECLQALGRLMDEGIAQFLSTYLDSVVLEHPVAIRIRKELGPAMERATFHLRVKEMGLDKLVHQLTLEMAATMTNDTARVVQGLEFLDANMDKISPRIDPNTGSEFQEFLRLAPDEYRHRIEANSAMFYVPRAKARSTGMGYIVSSRPVWSLIRKGLHYRDYMAQQGYRADSYIIKEF